MTSLLRQVAENFLLDYEDENESWLPDDQDGEGWDDLVDAFHNEIAAAVYDRWVEWRETQKAKA